MLKLSGFVCLPSGDKFRDYRQQLVSWEEYEREVASYGWQQPDTAARKTDQGFPQNEYLRIENDEPALSPVRGKSDPKGLRVFESRLKERLEPIEILDALVDTEHWLNWSRFFGPLSGHDAKPDRPRRICCGWPSLSRVGRILPSDILRRLGSYSRKNKLYFAFRELGRVVRTIFLLRYVADADLRQAVHAATTKSERFNRFVQWVAFGGNSMIAENVRDEQPKFTKYNHLIANLLVFYNVVTMTKALQQLEAHGHAVSDEVLAALSPYQTEHINRFGTYVLNFDRTPEPLKPELHKPLGEETANSAGVQPLFTSNAAA